MSLLNKSVFPVICVISVPLLILGGCAGPDVVKVTSTTNIVDEYEASLVETAEPDIAIYDESKKTEPLDASEITQSIDNVEIKNINEEPIEKVIVGIKKINKQITPMPDENIIGFDFDKSEIQTQYGDLLWQHAQFLKENKNFILQLSGHTDSLGNKIYNENLSKQRAEKVAKILIDFGVPENRIKIIAYGSDVPLVGALNIKENRRVEFDYEDSQLVSN